jgi:CRISPR-associated protein Csm3
MKLKSIKAISGKIRVITGLHIGGSKDNLEIGGMDQPVIKHPLTKEPYIPGSSINFVDRESTRKFVAGEGKPCGCGEVDCPACKIFGTSSDKKMAELGSTRIIVRDAVLTEHFRTKFAKGELPMEEKYENVIHRVKGTAENPRPLERVPAGVEFDFNISFKEFEGDEAGLLDYVYKGLKMIELDALGGNSSRGCGQVKFVELHCDGQPLGKDFLDIIQL